MKISHAHFIAHVLRALGWPLFVLGFVAFLGGFDWIWGKYSIQIFFSGLVAMPIGLVLLHVSWNLRRNFYKLIP